MMKPTWPNIFLIFFLWVGFFVFLYANDPKHNADLAAPLQLTTGPLPVEPATEETQTVVPTKDLNRGPICNGHPLSIQMKGNLLPIGATRSLDDRVKNNVLWAGSKDRRIWAVDVKNWNSELCLTLLEREDKVPVAINDISDGFFATDGSGIVELDENTSSWVFHDHLPDLRTYCVRPESGYLYACTLEGFARFDGIRWETVDALKVPDNVTQFHQMALINKDWWLCSVGYGTYRLQSDGRVLRYSKAGLEEWNKGWRLIGSGTYPTACRDIKRVTFGGFDYVALVGDEVIGALAFVPVAAGSPTVDGINFSNLTSITPLLNGYVVTANAGGGAGGSFYVPSVDSSSYLELTHEASYDALFDEESGKLYIAAESGIWEFTPTLP